jgi:hypothetical protein
MLHVSDDGTDNVLGIAIRKDEESNWFDKNLKYNRKRASKPIQLISPKNQNDV